MRASRKNVATFWLARIVSSEQCRAFPAGVMLHSCRWREGRMCAFSTAFPAHCLVYLVNPVCYCCLKNQHFPGEISVSKASL